MSADSSLTGAPIKSSQERKLERGVWPDWLPAPKALGEGQGAMYGVCVLFAGTRLILVDNIEFWSGLTPLVSTMATERFYVEEVLQ